MNDALADRRQGARATVMFLASLDHDGSSVAVKLHNLSLGGAQLTGERLPQEGAQVGLRRHDLLIGGRIVWRNGQVSGIEFERPVAFQDVRREVPMPPPLPLARSRRPGLKTVPLSSADAAFLDRWAQSGGRNLGD